MGQLTQNFVDLAMATCKEGRHPSLTVWEAQQLLHAWNDREALRARDEARTTALRFALNALQDHIATEDGLDDDTAVSVCMILTEAIEDGTFDKRDPDSGRQSPWLAEQNSMAEEIEDLRQVSRNAVEVDRQRLETINACARGSRSWRRTRIAARIAPT